MAVDYNVITHYIKNRYVFLINGPEKHISITKIECKALIARSQSSFSPKIDLVF